MINEIRQEPNARKGEEENRKEKKEKNKRKEKVSTNYCYKASDQRGWGQPFIDLELVLLQGLTFLEKPKKKSTLIEDFLVKNLPMFKLVGALEQ